MSLKLARTNPETPCTDDGIPIRGAVRHVPLRDHEQDLMERSYDADAKVFTDLTDPGQILEFRQVMDLVANGDAIWLIKPDIKYDNGVYQAFLCWARKLAEPPASLQGLFRGDSPFPQGI